MKRIRKTKPRRPSPLRRVQRNLGPRHLRAMSKTELVALAMRLQGEAPKPRATSLVIASSLRSGQIVEFPDGDVTVIGSVGSGAEIVAGGSIHVYGALRGRAVAGLSGNAGARIFCHSLQAELLSIDGHYRVAEHFDPALRGRPVQAYLDGLRMAIEPMDAGERDTPVQQRSRAAERLMHLLGVGAEHPVAAAAAR